MSFIQRLMSPVVDLRREETLTAFLLFAYSFLAMTVWNTIKPLTRSTFIRDLGADNLPYVLLAAGLVIGILMVGYAWLFSRLPRRWGLPIVQTGMAGLLVLFWFLFQTEATWVSVVFYVLGLIFGLLLISQFWTVANLVYNPRQAKRLFGFIGGGAPLGGMAGSAFAAVGASRIGSLNLLLPSAALMLLSAGVTAWIIRRERVDMGDVARDSADQATGVGAGEALTLLRQSSHLRLIALVISLAAIGAAIIEQQLNMAAEANLGAEATDSITSLLGWIGVWMSGIGFVIQVWLTSRIHRYLGVGFALMILPVSLGTSAVIMLFNAALWAPALARVLDQSLRYTVDKTSREILFIPLPDAIKLKAKPFVDVTVDRAARAGAALLLLLLVKPWGLNLDWQRISYASLTMMALWLVTALRARRGYVRAFRQSIERQDLAPADMRLSGADLTTVETLVQELAHVDAHRVVYAIDVLESLGKRNLVTPLLLHHASPAVRERALQAMAAARSGMIAEWLPQIRRLLGDDEPRVRAAAVQAIGALSNQDAAALARSMTADRDARIRATAATVLAGSSSPDDVALAEATLVDLAGDASEQGRAARLQVAAAVREIGQPRFRRLLIPLLNDPAPDVAEAALRSVQAVGAGDILFVPALVALLGRRELKERAREVLVSFGEPVIDPLAYFLRDRDENVWVRRHIPGTLARIRSQRSVDVLVDALSDPDGFLRFKAIAGLEQLRHRDPNLSIPRAPVESQAVHEAAQYFTYLLQHDNLFRRGGLGADSLLALALEQKIDRSRRRIYRLLSLIYPWQDVAAAERALDRGDAHARSSASEFLDNMLGGDLRRWIVPALEDLTVEEKVRRGHELMKTRPLHADETLSHLVEDADPVIAAAAIDMVRQAGLWKLGADIERVLADRDGHVGYVAETAAWALANRRRESERQDATPAPLPLVVVAARLHALPLFAPVTADELFRIAGRSRQIRHEPGAPLAYRDLQPQFVHLLLEGRISTESDGRRRMIDSPAALGVVEVLQGTAMPETLRASGRAVTLALTPGEFRTLLADNTDLVSGLLSTCVDEAAAVDVHAVDPAAAASTFEQLAAGGVVTAEKMVVLEHLPLFAGLSAEEAQHVAGIARTVPLNTGDPLFAIAAIPAIWIVLSGEIALERPDTAPLSAPAGSVVGALAMLSGRPLGRAARVVKEGVALRIERDDLFDLLGERPALLSQLLTGVFGISAPQPAPAPAVAALA
jgi:ATP/ADP translocase/HEAT repeat protein/CRP-like cAMP-binding protein